MHVTTNDDSGRTPVTPERTFGEALKATRVQAGVSQAWVAEQMRLRGFEEYEQTKVSGIERGSRPLRMNEAVALARITNADLIGMFVASVAEDSTIAESAVIAERLAFRRVVAATDRMTELQVEAKDLETRIADATSALEVAEAEWQEARRKLEEEER